MIAILTIGLNTFTDAITRVALGVDRREVDPPAAASAQVPLAVGATTEPGEGVSVPTLLVRPLDAPRLRVEDLTIASTRGVEILQDVSLDVIAGEVLGLVGESGSGKTTLALGDDWLRPARPPVRRRTRSARRSGFADLVGAGLRRLRGSPLAYVPQDPGDRAEPVPQGRVAAARGPHFHDHHGAEVEDR